MNIMTGEEPMWVNTPAVDDTQLAGFVQGGSWKIVNLSFNVNLGVLHNVRRTLTTFYSYKQQ